MSTKLVIQRGTGVRDVEESSTVWSGEPFLEYQEKKLTALSHNMSISINRGTGSMKVSEYPHMTKKIDLGGFILSTERGTATRLL